MPEAAEEELLEKQAYTSDLEEAKDDKSKLAEVYKHHFGTIGGTYLAIVLLHSKVTIHYRRRQSVAFSHESMGLTLTPPSESLPVVFCPVPLGHSIRSA